MGLFIGASLLTILEILDYLCEVGENPRCHGEESGHQCLRREMLATLLLPLVPRFFTTESWGTSGTEGALKGALATLW